MVDVKELLVKSEINPFMSLPVYPTILSINGVNFGTRGDFSCIVGKPKSRKTFLLSLLESICLSENLSHGAIQSFIGDSTILHFDTEQSNHYVQKYTKRVYSLLGRQGNIPNFKVFSLREFDANTRVEIIEEALDTYRNISLVVIDGIADLVNGYNDETLSNSIVGKLMKWSKDLNIHIITVIHHTKSSEEPKGHLGSFISQKAETVLHVNTPRNNSTTTVKSQNSRSIEIPTFEFIVDSNGLPRYKF
ncbi:AAA family ATPase [Hyunsoonleella sp. SJ7]|uniref:AAA family ATPase n=1 Tax=Hyunsoonleella aquatilis TaxID=2762758 RepID=A0A923KJ58_9FLAO|nr:AAA family ATPase [Hyunsoonleella aquatilis]MBC3759714.1 AAA family ATPase [Hyunsoonleella aquatilis]